MTPQGSNNSDGKLTERLRAKVYRREIWHEPDGTMDAPCDADDYGAEAYDRNPDGPEAADTIERQQATITALVEAGQAAFEFLGGVNGAVEIRGQLLAALSLTRSPEGGEA